MIDFIFGSFGVLVRWIFVYKCNSKRMSEAYQANTAEEGTKNNIAGFILIPIAIIIGLIVRLFDNVSSPN